jgi:hypothetical protein
MHVVFDFRLLSCCSAETQPAQWVYRSEGGAHSVYAFSGSNRRYIGKLLRVPKSNSHKSTGHDMLAAIWRKDLLPSLIPREFLPGSVPCELDSRWVADLETSAESTRPEHRKDAGMESRLEAATEAKSRPALLMEDLVGTGGLRSGNRVLVAEIKVRAASQPQADSSRNGALCHRLSTSSRQSLSRSRHGIVDTASTSICVIARLRRTTTVR